LQFAQIKLFTQSKEYKQYKLQDTHRTDQLLPSTACVVCNGVGCTELKPF